MTPTVWPCPTPDGGSAGEFALTFDRARGKRLLIVPALFDEANRMRRFTVEVMRRLDAGGIDAILPDLPGCHDSLQPLERQTVANWRDAMAAATRHFGASHVLAVRGGSLLTPRDMAGWLYAPAKGASIVRQLLRSRILASREAGIDETQEGLLERGSAEGLELSGFRLGAAFLREFRQLVPGTLPEIAQDRVGGGALWLRAEPGEDAAQADALAAIIIDRIMA